MTVEECMKQVKKAISTKKINIANRKPTDEPAKFGPEKEEIQEVDNRDNDKFRREMRECAIFAHTDIKRDALEYVFRKYNINRTPEEFVFALGIELNLDDNTYANVMNQLKNNSIPDAINGESKIFYMKQGINLIEEMMKAQDKQDYTKVEKNAKIIANLYEKEYSEWEEKFGKQINKDEQEQSVG